MLWLNIRLSPTSTMSLNVYFVLSDCCIVHFLFFSLCHGDFHVFKCTAIVVIIIFEIV